MKLITTTALLLIVIFLSLSVAESNGDLSVSGATITNDLAIASLDCTANTNGGALTTDSIGIVVCSDDDGATGPHTVDTDTTYTAGTGLLLGGGVFSASFGAASTQVAAGNHNHAGTYLPVSTNISCSGSRKVTGLNADGSVNCGDDINTTYATEIADLIARLEALEALHP